jgi:uncharacterized membrane protein YhaH (DUF805 family)
VNWYLEVWRKYGVSSGRARRKEYWIFFFCNFLVYFILMFVDAGLGTITAEGDGLLMTIYAILVIVPSITVGIRRMHDTDHGGWWILVPLFNLIFFLTPGTPGPNRFGPEPAEELQVA